jgi:hypothetical protein
MLDHPLLAEQAANPIHDYFYRVNGEMQAFFLDTNVGSKMARSFYNGDL